MKKRNKDFELVCFDDDPGWLDNRYNFITASESSAVMERCPWSTREDVLRKKLTKHDDFKGTRNTWWGKELEEFNMQMFTKITGIRTRRCNAFLKSKRTSCMAATLDGFALRPNVEFETQDIATKTPWAQDLRDALSSRSNLGLIEMKNTESWFAKKWHAEPPEHYVIQVQHQLYVTGLDWCILCAKLGAGDMIAYLIDADPFLQDEIVEDATSLWKEINAERKQFDEYFG